MLAHTFFDLADTMIESFSSLTEFFYTNVDFMLRAPINLIGGTLDFFNIPVGEILLQMGSAQTFIELLFNVLPYAFDLWLLKWLLDWVL